MYCLSIRPCADGLKCESRIASANVSVSSRSVQPVIAVGASVIGPCAVRTMHDRPLHGELSLSLLRRCSSQTHTAQSPPYAPMTYHFGADPLNDPLAKTIGAAAAEWFISLHLSLIHIS